MCNHTCTKEVQPSLRSPMCAYGLYVCIMDAHILHTPGAWNEKGNPALSYPITPAVQWDQLEQSRLRVQPLFIRQLILNWIGPQQSIKGVFSRPHLMLTAPIHNAPKYLHNKSIPLGPQPLSLNTTTMLYYYGHHQHHCNLFSQTLENFILT